MARRTKKQAKEGRPAARPPRRQAPLYDQASAPPPPRRPRQGQQGMQQVVLPLQGPPQPAPQRARRRGRPTPSGYRRRVTRGEMRRRRRNRRIAACLLVLALIGVGVALSVTVLFKVEGYTVQNLDKTTPADTGLYTEEQIIAALGIPVGENIFRFSIAEKERDMALDLPLLEVIRVRRSLPGTLVVQVQPAVAAYCLQTSAGWATLSEQLKVMEVGPAQPSGLTVITGLTPETPVAGQPLAMPAQTPAPSSTPQASATPEPGQEDAAPQASAAPGTDGGEALEILRELLEQLASEERPLLAGVTAIDLASVTELGFTYEGRVKVLLGTSNNLDYKLQWAYNILTNADGKGLAATDTGTLDISHQRQDGTIRPVFDPG